VESPVKRLMLVSGDDVFPLEIGEQGGLFRVRLSGEPVDIDIGNHSGGGLSLLLDGRSYEAEVSVQDRQIAVELEGERFVFNLDEGDVSGKGTGVAAKKGLVEVAAPMPGKVVKFLVSPGEAVEAGQGVLLFEAMKMQNEIRSPLAGSVVEIVVTEGRAVEARERLFTVQGA